MRAPVRPSPNLVTFTFYERNSTCELSSICLFATPWTVDLQAPLSMGFLKQEYWSGLPFPTPDNLPDLGIKHMSPACPLLARFFFFFLPCTTWEAHERNRDTEKI